MGPFELTFSLFGLLLGLSFAQILGGFAKAAKRIPRYRMGFLTPLLCLFLLYDISTFWITAWTLRALLPTQIGTLVVGLIITGLYYFAAVLIWPEVGDEEGWNDLNGWMLRQKRKVLLSMLAANAINLTGVLLLIPGGPGFTSVQYALMILYFVGLLAGSFARGKKQTLAALILLIALYAGDLYVNVAGAELPEAPEIGTGG